MIALILGYALFFGAAPPARCEESAVSHGRLQWSEPAHLVSPNREWMLELKPLLTAEENQSPVLLHACDSSDSSLLITLARRADAYWGPDGNSLLVIDQPASDSYKPLVFSNLTKLNVNDALKDSNALDVALRKNILQQVGAGAEIEFYLPRFVAWNPGSLVLAVGGSTSSGKDGPMKSYCFGFVIDGGTLQISDTLSAKDLHSKYKAACQVSP
jgi:hypothetical protein